MIQKPGLLSLSAIALLLVCVFSNAEARSVLIYKVAYCRAAVVCNERYTAGFQHWDEAGVRNGIQKETYIGAYNEPSYENVEHVVYLASGQRWGDGASNNVTGQDRWSAYRPRNNVSEHRISDTSIPVQLFKKGIYSSHNTFVGLAFDPRYNFEFVPNELNQIANANVAWLKSKFNSSNLKSIYLGGHSRGGALVLRMAQKLKQEFPNVPVIVTAFDPVARMRVRELSTWNKSMNNPVMPDFPRNTGGLNNKGTWAWMADLEREFPNKKNLAILNIVNGGKLFGLAQETRAFTLPVARNQFTDLGWVFQHWFPSGNDEDGHTGVASWPSAINSSLRYVEDRLDMLTRNVAPSATVSASSTYHGYSIAAVNDTNLDSRLGDQFSWVNNGFPTGDSEWLQLTWADPVTIDRVELVSSQNYAAGSFKVQYLDGAQWRDVLGADYQFSAPGIDVSRVTFDEVQTNAIRLTNLVGPAHQPGYFRVNELLVRDSTRENMALQATASASSTYCMYSDCYSPAKVNDGDTNTALGAPYSWANGVLGQPAWLELSWDGRIRTDMVEVYSTDGYALRGFDVEYFVDDEWRAVQSKVASSIGAYTVVSFNPVRASKLRLVNFVGPEHQPGYFRVNEVVVPGRLLESRDRTGGPGRRF